MNFIIYIRENNSIVLSIIFTLSVFALAMVLIKLVQFFWLKYLCPSYTNLSLLLWRKGDRSRAISAMIADKHPVDRVVLFAMRGVSEDLDNASHYTLLREELQRLAIKELNRLKYFFRPLEIIATISPLLGLLGTVVGMIEAFQQLEMAGDQVNPSVLSGGIWQALLTTAGGLSVAIFVVVFHSFFDKQVELIKQRMEDSLTQVFTQEITASIQEGKDTNDSLLKQRRKVHAC